jgi:hypothetical protein
LLAEGNLTFSPASFETQFDAGADNYGNVNYQSKESIAG